MKSRLTKKDWLRHGLKVLARAGAGALKAEPLARSLKVSRGSFYWHFADISEFHAELLIAWRERSTDSIIVEVGDAGDDASKLGMLMRKAMCADDRLERAIRSWATQNAMVATVVAAVDKKRLAYLAQLLRDAGVPEHHIQIRAQFIYAASLGRMMMTKGRKDMSDTELDTIAELLQSS